MLIRFRIFAAHALVVVAIVLPSASIQAQKPAIVKSIDEPGRTPYSSEIRSSCDGSCNVEFKAVPAGFRLVVTYIAASYITAPNASGPSLAYLDGGTAFLFLPVVVPASNNGVTRYYVQSTPITCYVESGHAPVFGVANVTSITASLFGYLVAVD